MKLTSRERARKVRRGVKPRFNYDRPSAARIVIGKILKIISVAGLATWLIILRRDEQNETAR